MLLSLPFNVVSFFPGHVRLRIENIRKNHDYAKKVEELLIRIRGITSVESNPLTGSILIKYDPRTIDVESLVSEGIENKFISGDSSCDIKYVKKIMTAGLQ